MNFRPLHNRGRRQAARPTEVEIDSETLMIMKESDIMGVLAERAKKKKKAA